MSEEIDFHYVWAGYMKCLKFGDIVLIHQAIAECMMRHAIRAIQLKISLSLKKIYFSHLSSQNGSGFKEYQKILKYPK